MNIIKWFKELFRADPVNTIYDDTIRKLLSPENAFYPAIIRPMAQPTILAKQEFWKHGGFIGNLIPAKPRKPERKQSCKGCGSFEYTVIDNADVCEYCGREYERTDLKPNPNIKPPVFTTTGWLTDNDKRKLNNLPLVPLSPNDILEY